MSDKRLDDSYKSHANLRYELRCAQEKNRYHSMEPLPKEIRSLEFFVNETEERIRQVKTDESEYRRTGIWPNRRTPGRGIC